MPTDPNFKHLRARAGFIPPDPLKKKPLTPEAFVKRWGKRHDAGLVRLALEAVREDAPGRRFATPPLADWLPALHFTAFIDAAARSEYLDWCWTQVEQTTGRVPTAERVYTFHVQRFIEWITQECITQLAKLFADQQIIFPCEDIADEDEELASKG